MGSVDVDTVVVNETFPAVPSVNVADDVVGGHGVRCLISVKLDVFLFDGYFRANAFDEPCKKANSPICLFA